MMWFQFLISSRILSGLSCTSATHSKKTGLCGTSPCTLKFSNESILISVYDPILESSIKGLCYYLDTYMTPMKCRPPYLSYILHILSTYLWYLWSIGPISLPFTQHSTRNTKSFSTLFYQIRDLLTTLRIYNYNNYYYKI
jgi:hypothetical protein